MLTLIKVGVLTLIKVGVLTLIKVGVLILIKVGVLTLSPHLVASHIAHNSFRGVMLKDSDKHSHYLHPHNGLRKCPWGIKDNYFKPCVDFKTSEPRLGIQMHLCFVYKGNLVRNCRVEEL